ncbi:hypothetical protein [Actinoplanes sp. NPDC049802]|uniref:hypothetical protein n=1 Tax=Actinoplanes sp. NPDC049802 TaxID=3154742 RepID=UPI0033C4E4DB
MTTDGDRSLNVDVDDLTADYDAERPVTAPAWSVRFADFLLRRLAAQIRHGAVTQEKLMEAIAEHATTAGLPSHIEAPSPSNADGLADLLIAAATPLHEGLRSTP